MNAQAHMSGHISGQVPNQASQQFSGLPQQMSSSLPSQIQNFGGHSMDPELHTRRREVQEYIFRRLQKRSNSAPGEFAPKLSEIAKRLEEYIYRDVASKEDYINMNGPTIDQRLQSLAKPTTNNSQLNSHHFPSSSAVGTMIPTPGMAQNSSTNSMVGPAENVMNANNAAAMVMQTTSNTGNLLPIANGLGGVGNATSFNMSDGQVPNGYRKMTSNASLGTGVTNTMSSVVPQPPSQMIPTPGLNNFKPTAVNPDFSNAGGLLVNESSMVSQQLQHKHYVGSQSSHIFQNPGAQMGGRMRPNMPKPSPYGFPNGRLNGGLGLTGAKQLVTGPAASEGYLSAASYGSSPKRLQEHFDQQHHQPMLPASLPSQTLSMTGDGYAITSVDVSGSGNLYGQVPSAINHQNANPASLNPKSKISLVAQSNNVSLQSMQQSTKPQILDQSQSMDFQTPQTIREHLVQSQHQLQNLQNQQFQQQSSQPYSNIIQNQQQNLQQQQQQQGPQHEQLTTKTDSLRQSLMISNLGGQLVSDHGNESHNELLLSQTAEQFQLSEVQNHWPQRTSVNNHSGSGQSHGQLSSSHYFHQSVSQDLHNPFPLHQQTSEFQNDLNCLTNGSQPDSLLHGHWHSHPSQKSHMLERSSLDQQIKEEFNERTTGQGEFQQSYNILDGFISSSDGATKVAVVQQSSGSFASGPGDSKREQDYYNQQRWLLFLFHASTCPAPKGACKEVNCVKVQQLWSHIKSCKSDKCPFPRCIGTKKLYQHYTSCRKADCPVCKPVRAFLQRAACSRSGLVDQKSNSQRPINATDVDRVISNDSSPLVEASKPCADPHSLPKRMKTEHIPPTLAPKSEASPVYIQLQTAFSEEVQLQGHQEADPAISVNSEIANVHIGTSMSPGHGNPPVSSKVIHGSLENVHRTQSELESASSHDIDGHKQQENIHDNKELDQVKIEQKHESNGSLTDCTAGSKSGKPKIKGVSLTELFTPEQVREHIVGLRQWVGQSKAKVEKNQAMEHSMSENSCQLCAVEKLTFEPPPIYCSSCGARIKRNATYYTVGTGDSRHYFCIPCYNEARGDTIEVDGSTFPKSRLDKKRNDEETEEWWVQCDKCEAWQHQICALFNGRRNDGGQAEYTCPNCYIGEVERGERMPLPQNAVLGAKDLPRTLLSDHIEQRLFRRLRQERQERARHLGKSFDEVPGAEALVIRVVSSVDKKLEVKQRFLEIFQEENYPTEFPYKSKVVLLFQKIEGVEVCLFGMYVQEFGSECQFPNQRRVYLSYLDSVKYFRPEIKAVTGEALRTFVYHEILIGYLEYCKKRGFTSCYIWACPPLKGEDYILYCHPEIQKTPKSDKLREWYLSMLRKASKEKIVADLTNLYDHFFVKMGECKAKVTAARLPYFDGDYWPGAAEDMINQLRQEEDGRNKQKKGKTKKIISKRALKAAGQADLSGNASKDALLMQKLGETIYPMKEDFIMVHLQHACTHCCLLMISGTRWVCNQCKNFQLCDKCHDGEQRLEERERHPINSREKHMLYPMEINDVPSDTKDKDEILESEFFDTRQAFLSLCQGNHYQYDTLRRAKHSSMMVLYHLHNPTAPAFVTTCNVCHQDIETGQGWRCEICPDFDVCNACNQKDGGVDHPHKLTNHPSMADRDAQNKEARQKRVLQLRKMLDLLVHASQCRFSNCQYPNCRKVKGLFRHGIQCKKRVVGGCPLCKKMWYLLQLHARACKESECHVPRCKDLKEHLKRLQQQSDSRRRAAVMEMMRQRAAEVAGNTD